MTIEELKVYSESILDEDNHDELWHRALMRYAEENNDELLKTSVDELITRRTLVPWGSSKIIEFTIGKEKLIWDHEAKALKGPSHIVKEIEEANERWRDEPDFELFEPDSYAYQNFYAPPGDLWDPCAFAPLVYRVYGKNVTHEVLEFYPKDPLDEIYKKLGYEMSITD